MRIGVFGIVAFLAAANAVIAQTPEVRVISHGTAMALRRNSTRAAIAIDSSLTVMDGNTRKIERKDIICKLDVIGARAAGLSGTYMYTYRYEATQPWTVVDVRSIFRRHLTAAPDAKTAIARTVAELRPAVQVWLDSQASRPANVIRFAEFAVITNEHGYPEASLTIIGGQLVLGSRSYFEETYSCPGDCEPTGEIGFFQPGSFHPSTEDPIKDVSAGVQKAIETGDPDYSAPVHIASVGATGPVRWDLKPPQCSTPPANHADVPSK